MSEEMNKEAEVQEEAVDIPVTDGSEEEAADTAQAAEEEASDDTAAPEETEQQPEEAESQKEPETKTKTSFFGKKKKEKDKFEQQIMFAEKSWGSFRVLDVEGTSMTIKVTLNPGHSMNYHSHKNRDEVWVVISGNGRK